MDQHIEIQGYGGDNPPTNYTAFVGKILDTLQITDSRQGQLRGNILIRMAEYDNKTKHAIVSNQLLQRLIESDQTIATNLAIREYMIPASRRNIKLLWDEFIGKLAVMQAMVILRNIGNDRIIEILIELLNQKLDTVNAVLESNLTQAGGQSGGNKNEVYMQKFLKYKLKSEILNMGLKNYID